MMSWRRAETVLWVLVALLAGVFILSLFPQAEKADGVSTTATSARLRPVGSFSQPLEVAQAAGDNRRLFVVEQTGRIQVLVDGKRASKPFLDIRNLVSCCGEQGLLGVAFAPDYQSSGLFYVDYTDRNGDTRIVEYRRSSNPNQADPASARTVLFQDQPQGNHNGGKIAFGPDGYLYIALGDGGGQGDQHGAWGNAQNLASLLGKILRIDPKRSGAAAYRIPQDNPFRSSVGARGEIWAYGLRNPWRFSFDRQKGGMIIGDVGASEIEEIDWAPPPSRGRGRNYGWRVWEGTRRNKPSELAAAAVFPTAQYSHAAGRCSVTGGYVVRDARLKGLYGRYLFADFCSGEVWIAALRDGRLASRVSKLPLRVNQPASFGEDNQGRIYLSSLQGQVYRLDP